MFKDSWVCRACWKPNRAGDNRCYRCKTPRDAQASVEAGSLKEKADPAWQLRGRLDAQFPLVAYLLSWPFRISGVLSIVSGVLIFLIGLLADTSVDPTFMGIPPNVMIGLIGLAVIIIGALQLFVGRSIQRFARWAYVLALLTTVPYSFPTLLGLVEVPPSAGDGAATASLIGAWIYFALAVMAAFLLVTSFVPRREPRPEAQPEAASVE
jgi:hypothetical protein